MKGKEVRDKGKHRETNRFMENKIFALEKTRDKGRGWTRSFCSGNKRRQGRERETRADQDGE